MEPPDSLIDWTTVILGVVLLMWGVTPSGMRLWGILLGGTAVALVGIWSLANPDEPTPELVNVALGLLVALTPALLGYSGAPNATIARLVGPCVAMIALSRVALLAARRHPRFAAHRGADARHRHQPEPAAQ